MRESKRGMARFLKYQWDFYSYLAHQRNIVQDELRSAIIEKTIKNYSFENWQRAVKYKYSLPGDCLDLS
jgi:hypothetical protein